jgi:hypothetical protein
MTRVSRKEAKLLRKRSDEMDRKGGGLPLAEVERRMLADMIAELHRMARAYDGSPRRAKELLDAILTAQEEGISSEVFAAIRREAAASLKQRAA